MTDIHSVKSLPVSLDTGTRTEGVVDLEGESMREETRPLISKTSALMRWSEGGFNLSATSAIRSDSLKSFNLSAMDYN